MEVDKIRIEKIDNQICISTKGEKIVINKNQDYTEKIFWLPILEREYKLISKELKKERIDNSWLGLFLVRSAIRSQHAYWLNLALDWYQYLDADEGIEEMLLDIMNDKSYSQKLRHKVSIIKKYKGY